MESEELIDWRIFICEAFDDLLGNNTTKIGSYSGELGLRNKGKFISELYDGFDLVLRFFVLLTNLFNQFDKLFSLLKIPVLWSFVILLLFKLTQC